MFALERIRIIKTYLLENRQVEVHALSAMLGVSEVTIRRDLEKLESEGFLTRTHGGAVLRTFAFPEVEGGEADEDESAREIAGLALNLVEDGDVLMLSGGSVCESLARRLRERGRLTVLTNNMDIGIEISAQPANRVVLLGGDVADDGKSLYGSLAVANLRRFHVNRLFVEIDAIASDLSVCVESHEKAELIEAAMDSAQEKILLCRSENFDKTAFFKLGAMSMADKLITNPDISDDFKQRIFTRNIQLHTALNLFEGKV